MRAYEIQQFGIDELVTVDRDVPRATATEVVVRFDAFSLNYRDVMVVSGTYNPRMKMPATPLSDAAGVIVEVGSEVAEWSVGDRVMPLFAQRWFDGESDLDKSRSAMGAGPQVDGVACEFRAFDAKSVVAVPEYLSQQEAATLPCAAVTAWNALVVSGNVKAGDTVLTLGTGGVSIFALQIAKAFGARVIAISGSDEKIEKLKALGADETINYRKETDWENAVLKITERRGVDHVIEVGGAGTLARSVAATRISGHVAMIGALAGGGVFDPVAAFMKAIRLQGIFVGSRSMFEDMNRFFAGKQIRPVIDRTFKFSELGYALNYMRSGSHFGKIVIETGE